MPRFRAWQGPCFHKRGPWHITGERRKASAQRGAVMLELRNGDIPVGNLKETIVGDDNESINLDAQIGRAHV